jgi:PPOX class probable F420-dependent enzyme
MAERAMLDPTVRAFVGSARRAALATVAPDGRPRLVPVCFVLLGEVVYTPLDEKPKAVEDPMRLARVRDVLANPTATLLVDRWDEDWSRLGWVRLDGEAALLDPPGDEHAAAVAALVARYPQYASHRLNVRPLIRITIGRVVSWGDLGT